MLPTVHVAMSLQLNETDQSLNYRFTDDSSNVDLFWIASSFTVFIIAAYIFILLYKYISQRHRKGHSCIDNDRFTIDRKILKGHSCKLDVVISDGVYVVSTSLDGLVRVWDLKSAECIMEVCHNIK